MPITKYGDVDPSRDEILIVAGQYKGQRAVVKSASAGQLTVKISSTGKEITIDETACEMAKK